VRLSTTTDAASASSKVAGSSGTPDGFNAAIQQIKAEATN
jgi:hypothetical protein